jgi:uncharacterized membrane protein
MQVRRRLAGALRLAGGAYPLLIFALCRNGMSTEGVGGLVLLYIAVGLPLVFCSLSVGRAVPGEQRIARYLTFMVCLLVLAALVWWLAPLLQPHYQWFFLLQDLGFFGLLAFYFGSSLRAGREPLCTYFARLVVPSPSAQLVAYTRTVTAAWTVFFIFIGAVSSCLFFASTSTLWAFFTNLVTPVLILLFFAIENACRWRFLPPGDRVGFRKTLVAIRKGGYRGKQRGPVIRAIPAG